MRFHRIGSVIICPTAKSLVFLTKCMYLWLWTCGVQWYLPLSAALGGFCVALQKGVVSPRLHTLPSKTDSQPACLLISLCEIPERGDSIKIINKDARISPYFWCGFRHCDRAIHPKKLVPWWAKRVRVVNCTRFNNSICVCSTAKTVHNFSVIPVALFTFATRCWCMCMCQCDTQLQITCWRSQRNRRTLPKLLIITFGVDFESLHRFIPPKTATSKRGVIQICPAVWALF